MFNHLPSLRRLGLLALICALIAGAVLRLIWGLDIEYKYDEEWMFEKTQNVGVSEPWPTLGLQSSAGCPNPALNVWIFVGLGKVCGVQDPPGLARCVQVLSILALGLLVVFAYTMVPRAQREPWLWAAALMALNPVAVIYHRKIWQPSILPIFMVFFFMAWWQRERKTAAFFWGALGALLGQIHMPGFFFAAGFVLWTWFKERGRLPWGWWVAGSVVGSLPMIPWVLHLLNAPVGESVRAAGLENVLAPKMWFRWVTQPLGFGIHYLLNGDFLELLRYPLIGGRPTYLVLLLHVVLAAAGVWLLIKAGKHLWQSRQRWSNWFLGDGTSTGLAVAAGLWGFGVLITLSALKFHRHYLLVAMPLVFVWLARWLLPAEPEQDLPSEAKENVPEQSPQASAWTMGLQSWSLGRAVLVLVCLAQGLITWNLLSYIHNNQRYIAGDFRVPYGAQIRQAGFQESNPP